MLTQAVPAPVHPVPVPAPVHAPEAEEQVAPPRISIILNLN